MVLALGYSVQPVLASLGFEARKLEFMPVAPRWITSHSNKFRAPDAHVAAGNSHTPGSSLWFGGDRARRQNTVLAAVQKARRARQKSLTTGAVGAGEILPGGLGDR
ncbi:MAG: hypothetical protein L0Y50_01415 [Beijerinckiaceae bacterium]|nr:hypothetical protein [Beijerinckiaceae bacterium]